MTTVDVAVIGGGLSGLSLALILARQGLAVTVVDREEPERQLAAAFDGRTTAIAAGPRAVLERAGVWAALEAEACPIRAIRTADGDSRLFLDFDTRDVGAEAFGWIVENRSLRGALIGAAGAAGIRHLTGRALVRLEPGPGRSVIRLDDGTDLAARLVVGADGRASAARQALGIGVWGWDYGQDALVLTMAHERPHDHLAVERFLPTGPFATLPMWPDAEGRQRSSVVWSLCRDLVDGLMALPEAAFARQLGRRAGEGLGACTVLGRRFRHPLRLQLARRLTGARLALIGDAAHVLHPLAGQNLNVGLRDVGTLADLVLGAARLGGDPGAPGLLARYARRRAPDILALAAATDGLNRLFSNDRPLTTLARRLGLAAVERARPLKRFFMARAMGAAG